MRTVQLELLRHGPPHNQLLSPITPYIAICENHNATTIYQPYEHFQFLSRRALLDASKMAGSDLVRPEAEMLGRDIAKFLNQVEGLGQELALDVSEPVHLQIVHSASELALIPFELSQTIQGLPSGGSPFLLQSKNICMTRTSSRFPRQPFVSTDSPRILFAWSLPKDAESMKLVRDHKEALRKAIEPWLGLDQERDERESHLLHILGDCPIETLQTTLQTAMDCGQPFTHVHLVFHGKQYRSGFDDRWGLSAGSSEYGSLVSAERLCAALGCNHNGVYTMPFCVSLMTCHGADQGSVYGAGNSLGQALHEAGVSLVIASQFPLHFRGSRTIVEHFYKLILWGCDPRLATMIVRRALMTDDNRLDWASMVVFTPLRGDQEDSFIRHEFSRLRRFKNIWLRSFQNVVESNPLIRDNLGIVSRSLEQLKGKASALLERVESSPLVNRERDRKPFLHGMLASIVKTQAQIVWRTMNEEPNLPSQEEVYKRFLATSAQQYLLAFQGDRRHTWAIVQMELMVRLAGRGNLAEECIAPDPNLRWNDDVFRFCVWEWQTAQKPKYSNWSATDVLIGLLLRLAKSEEDWDAKDERLFRNVTKKLKANSQSELDSYRAAWEESQRIISWYLPALKIHDEHAESIQEWLCDLPRPSSDDGRELDVRLFNED
jgi:hypothetical protein